MDSDLEELVKSFSGYGIESWMKASYLAMANKVQELRNQLKKTAMKPPPEMEQAQMYADGIPRDPAPGTRWQHFKGTVYTVVRVSRDCEDYHRFVVTYEDSQGESWVRERSNFLGIHENGKKRFTQL